MRSAHWKTNWRIAPASCLATFFGCGLSPVAPGTAGSAAAIAIAFFLHSRYQWSPLDFAVLTVLGVPLGIWAAGVVADTSGNADPGKVVIDEVLGQWLSLSGAFTLHWKSCLAAFLLFRLFDIWKPFPVRQLESLHGGAGIVCDDIGAGMYAALVLFAAGWFNLI